jgi:hypothetical protein
LVASAALTAALALVALPGLAGSRTPSAPSVVDPTAFQPISISANAAAGPRLIAPLDPGVESAVRVNAESAFVTPGAEPERIVGRPSVRQPASTAGSAQKPPKYTLSGVATFYYHGTTAMRLPRGTTVVICGSGGCVERVITDYGPTAGTNRIVDLYAPDFFDICGCPSWSGTTNVTVSVY